MSPLEDVKIYRVSAAVASATDIQLQEAGEEGLERFVLWSGVLIGEEFNVSTVHVPRQAAMRLSEGLCVHVEGDELHRLNTWLFEHGERLGVQVHSHPGRAYHSETDDTFAIATAQGALSIVVPEFGAQGVRGPGVAVYRLSSTEWVELETAASARILRFEE